MTRHVQRRFRRFEFWRCSQERFASRRARCWRVARICEFQSIQNVLSIFLIRTELDAKFKFLSQPFQVIIRLATFFDVTTLGADFIAQTCNTESRVRDASPHS